VFFEKEYLITQIEEKYKTKIKKKMIESYDRSYYM
jgi:hypothetical protein